MKKIIKKIIAVIVSIACITQVSCQAFAASLTGKTYVKEMVISYGKTPDEAKNWLKNKGYKIIDCNINEGADDTFSKKRAVYLGYKTTMDADKAITDIKLMNMKGVYSVLDYQLLLKEQKANIRTFIDNFVVSVSEYRENYKKGQARAVAAHDILNLLYDDDTETEIGDLLLEKIKEEYTEDDFAKMSKEEQAKHADMTTILMQSNSTSVLAMEQVIALATDASDSVWTERYDGIQSYDSMIDEIIEEENVDPAKAAGILSSKYDEEAKLIASKVADYLDYLKVYTESGITLESSEAELEAYRKEKGDTGMTAWYTAGTQYEMLAKLTDEDDTSLLDIITDEKNDLEGADRYMLYPLVSVFTDGQRACLDFLTFYQIVSLGINGDDSVKNAMEQLKLNDKDAGSISIYDGIDRSIFSENVAMTSDANSLQISSDKDMSTNWFNDGISRSTKILFISLGVSVAATIGSFITSNYLSNAALKASHNFAEATEDKMIKNTYDYIEKAANEALEESLEESFEESLEESIDSSIDSLDEVAQKVVSPETLEIEGYHKTLLSVGKARFWHDVFYYAGITLTAVSMVIMGISLWKTYEDLKAYYNVDFSPIPMHMVHQGVNENDEKVFTYYTAVTCNRQEAQMADQRTSMLKGFGDINGDVGKQWVALYTTTDKAAGNPITADFVIQYGNSNVPDQSTALSLFGDKTAQNLTNSKGGFTYADNKNGIYLFYNTDSTVFAGSAISSGIYALIAGGSLIVFAVASFFISKTIRNKKNGKENAHA